MSCKIILKRLFCAVLLLLILCGCGSEDGSKNGGTAITKVTFSNGSSLSILEPQAGTFTVRGDGLQSVSGIEMTLEYDPQVHFGTPSISSGPLTAGFMSAFNSGTPGVIRIAFVGTAAIDGAGDICTVSFDAGHVGGPGLSFTSAGMIDTGGRQVR